MEPRIAKLLGDSASLNRSSFDVISVLPPPPVAPPRPLPVEPSTVGDDVNAKNTTVRNEYVAREIYRQANAQGPPVGSRQKSSVPIAEVLNNEAPTPPRPQQQLAPSTTHTAPFSGRLSDILLDPSQHHANKRRKLDTTETPASGNDLLKLPKLPQLPKKASRRPRIPPLLQGLHQPPPLPPEGRLIPPITDEAGEFRRDIGTRVALRSPAAYENTTDRDTDRETQSASIESKAHHEAGQERNKETSAFGQDKENLNQENAENATRIDSAKGRESKKRNKWSEQETRDLLHGVSKFGIGNWKKILQCPEFKFNQRSAVDLKDRFRTCCPGEGLKLRKPRAKDSQKDSARKQDESFSSTTTNQEDDASHRFSFDSNKGIAKIPRKPRGDSHKKSSAELAAMGIDKPFFKTKRRERREFTEEDDENLLRGFEKYGPVWHSMRDDEDLGFSSRHPTDLRDRFRIKYPEKYAKAGYKLKLKNELMLKEKEGSGSHRSTGTLDSVHKPEGASQEEPSSTSHASTTVSSTSIPNLRSQTLLQPIYPGFFEDDVGDEDEGHGERSPVFLNRKIFEWADNNPSQTITTTGSASIPTMAMLPPDFSMNILSSMDDIHINPLATLKLPMTSVDSNIQPSSNSLSLASPMNPSTVANISTPSTVSSTARPLFAPSKQPNMSSLLRTPNLPTIVFPHVPASSARSAMHNLPPPADLLSGLDMDARPVESQNAAFVLDDANLGFGYAVPNGNGASFATATLAPLGGAVARGILGVGVERMGGEEPLGERSVLNSSI
ncbi:hypothetical protein CC78DRAFT_201012 [Lojkania enalia]|uniref:Uncharacterized protein n=1 Tax=Lojkania enalia TaxID=147567 RepID=A0A9P4N6Z1_9PLEO|nr:hypothetical protein CC78DRAFT_201012 [Didymosphaeria enalia]